MKYFLTIIISIILFSQAKAQLDPTLAVGLESLTLKKGTIDVAVLTEIIMEKQKELKQEALKRFIIKLFPEDNQTTKLYVQNCLNILLNEKNPQVIEKEIMELTTNYALCIGIARAYAKVSTGRLDSMTKCYEKTILFSKNFMKGPENTKNDNLNAKAKQLYKSIDETNAAIVKLQTANATVPETLTKQLKSFQAELESLHKQRHRLELKNKYTIDSRESKNHFPFSIVLDVTSTILSQNATLKEKGFFKQKINYKLNNFYYDLTETAKENTSAKKLMDQMEALSSDIDSLIRPYISHYDIIKTFLSSGGNTNNSNDIINTLTESYLDRILANTGNTAYTSKIITEITKKSPSAFFKYYDSLSNKQNNVREVEKALREIKLIPVLQIAVAKSARDLKNFIVPDTAQYIKKNRNDTLSLNDSLKTIKKNYFIAFDNYNENKASSAANINKINKYLQTSKFTTKTLSSTDSLESNAVRDILLLRKDTLLKEFRKISHKIAADDNFFRLYVESVITQLSDLKSLKITNPEKSEEITRQIEGYSELIAKIYDKLNSIKDPSSITLKDINYFEKELITPLNKYNIFFTNFTTSTQTSVTLKYLQTLTDLLKVKVILNVKGFKKYNDEFAAIFYFISNLDNLDKAETYQHMINLLTIANEKVENNLENGNFKDTYVLFINAVKKYTLINTKDQYVEIDIASFLSELSSYYDKRNKSIFGLYLSLGLNQNHFLQKNTLPGDTEEISNIGFASEKLGVKFTFKKFSDLNSYRNAVPGDVQINKRSPFVNELYFTLYGSGLLYSVANTSTDSNFDYAHIGASLGMRFYNALDVNFIYGVPFIKREPPFRRAFIGIGLDIPLGEYLEKLRGRK